MPVYTPTRHALRHLSSLCRNIESASSLSLSISKLTSPLPEATSRSACAQRRLFGQRHCTTQSRQITLSCQSRSPPYIPKRNLRTTSCCFIQPAPSEDTDPQNTATPVLPDITNYYTLFPSTLPRGPPGPAPREQSSSSSSTTTSPSASAFSIHIPTLRKEFLQLQSLHHPDKYTSNGAAHQKALALSAFINAAYKTLSDPLLRAQYLLQLQYDVDVTSEDNTAHPTDQETLMEVMEAQERVEDAGAQEEVNGIKEENAERMLKTERKMGEAFESGDAQKAKEECVRLKYWRSLQGALDEWQPGKEVRLLH